MIFRFPVISQLSEKELEQWVIIDDSYFGTKTNPARVCCDRNKSLLGDTYNNFEDGHFKNTASKSQFVAYDRLDLTTVSIQDPDTIDGDPILLYEYLGLKEGQQSNESIQAAMASMPTRSLIAKKSVLELIPDSTVDLINQLTVQTGLIDNSPITKLEAQSVSYLSSKDEGKPRFQVLSELVSMESDRVQIFVERFCNWDPVALASFLGGLGNSPAPKAKEKGK